MTALLQIKPHVRRKPEDPFEDIYKAKHAQLREEVALMVMEREIAEIVRGGLEGMTQQ